MRVSPLTMVNPPRYNLPYEPRRTRSADPPPFTLAAARRCAPFHHPGGCGDPLHFSSKSCTINSCFTPLCYAHWPRLVHFQPISHQQAIVHAPCPRRPLTKPTQKNAHVKKPTSVCSADGPSFLFALEALFPCHDYFTLTAFPLSNCPLVRRPPHASRILLCRRR
jgi:hypothetical protein